MKLFRRIVGREKPASLEGVQVVRTSVEEQMRGIEPIYVKRFELTALPDVQLISEELRRGNILVIRITSLLNKDPEELKEAIEQLKGICQAIGGDLGRLDEEKIIATPQHILIQVKE
ncbi:MAG: cell division protein SepF [Candidatus Hadarchaeales archaeon]